MANNKMIPAEVVVGFAVGVAYIWGSTAMMLKWPNTPGWVSWGLLALSLVVLMLLAYRWSRRTTL